MISSAIANHVEKGKHAPCQIEESAIISGNSPFPLVKTVVNLTETEQTVCVNVEPTIAGRKILHGDRTRWLGIRNLLNHTDDNCDLFSQEYESCASDIIGVMNREYSYFNRNDDKPAQLLR